MEYISTQEAAEKWGVTIRYVQRLLSDGRIPGARKYGVSWMIPANSEKPQDPRRYSQPPAPCSPFSFFPLIYIHGGDLDGARRRCKSEEELALFEALLACFCCDPVKAMEIAQPFSGRTSDTLHKLGWGIVSALAAMSRSDVNTWNDTVAELEGMHPPDDMIVEMQLALSLLTTGLHGRNTCPAWLEKGDFTKLPPEYFPLARYIYVKNIYINWKELDLVVAAEPLISECHREKSDLAEIHLRIIAAVAYRDFGNNAYARAHIEAAAAIAEPLGLFSPFVQYYYALGRFMDDCIQESYPRLLAALQKYGKSFWENWVELYNKTESRPMSLGLTPREYEAARMRSRGMTTKEIAKHMGISQSSVKKYLNVAYSKMNIKSKEEIRSYIHS